MNTSVPSISALSSSGAMAKAQSSDAPSGDAPFKQILTREVADRNSAEKSKLAPSREVGRSEKSADNNTDTNKTDTSTQATSASAEDQDTKDSGMPKEVGDSSSADQLLLVAAQFSPVTAEITAQTSTRNTVNTVNALTGTPMATESGLKTVETGVALATTNPENTAGAVKTPPAFDTSLNAASETIQGQETSKPSDKSVLSDSLLPKGQAMEKMADASPMTASGNSAVDKTPDARTDLAASLAPLQQAMANRAQSFGQATERIAPHVGTPAWNQAIGQKMVWMVGNEQQVASLTLNPPDLGPLQVVLSISSTQANASFYAAQPEVRQALEAALPKLREMLGDAGIQLGEANVSAGSPQQQESHSERRHTSHGLGNTGDTLNSMPAATTSLRISREGLIDTFA